MGGFIARTIIFTLALVRGFNRVQPLSEKGTIGSGESYWHSFSGYMFTLSNFWISLLMGTIAQVFEGTAVLLEWVVVHRRQLQIFSLFQTCFGNNDLCKKAYKSGDASKLIPHPTSNRSSLAGIFVYFLVFLLDTCRANIHPRWLAFGIICIITSTFLAR